MEVKYTIKSFNGGISTQSSNLKYPTQVSDMINFNITDDGSVYKRNGMNFLRNLDVKSDGYFFDYNDSNGTKIFGSIFKDTDYYVYLYNTSTDTFTKTKISGFDDYLNAGNGSLKDKLQVSVTADTIFVINKEVVVEKESKVDNEIWSASNNKKVVFYWVKRAFDDGAGSTNSGYTYILNINGINKTTKKENTTSAASDLASQWNGVSGYSAKAIGSIVRVQKNSGTINSVKFGDSYGNLASFGWVNQVDKTADLPKQLSGFTSAECPPVAISGVQKNETGLYYLKWLGDHWKEVSKDCIIERPKSSTMPFKIVDNGSSVAISSIDYDWKNTGDDDSNPTPSFIDKTISNVIMFKKRLCIISENNVICSRADDIYNFYAESAIDTAPDDVIDVSADTNEYLNIEYSLLFNGGIMLWTKSSQLLFGSGKNPLTTDTANIITTSEYLVDLNLEPRLLDNSLFFFGSDLKYISASIMTLDQLGSDRTTADTVSLHCSKLIPSSVFLSTSSNFSNQLFLIDNNTEPTTNIYVYKYSIVNGKTVISAWYKWNVPIENIIYSYTTNDELLIVDSIGKLYSIKLRQNEDDKLDLGQEFSSTIDIDYLVPFSDDDIRDNRNKFFLKNIAIVKDGYCDIILSSNSRVQKFVVKNKYIDKRPFFVRGLGTDIYLQLKSDTIEPTNIGSMMIAGESIIKYEKGV